jgi:hypothetical protein
MTDADRDLKTALRRYAERAIETLREAGWSLPPKHSRDWGWRAAEDGFFVYRPMESASELLPYDLRSLHEGPEFAACLDALRAHPVIRERLDTLVGSLFSASRLEAERIPDRVLYRMLRASVELRFSDSDFDAAADELIAWLSRDKAVYTTVAPLSGVTADATPIGLEEGIEIDVMSDEEVINCLTTGIFTGFGSMEHMQVGPRIALRVRQRFDLIVGEREFDADQLQTYWERWRDLGESVVFALRLLKPGNVSSPGFVSRGDEHPGGHGGSFTPSSTPRHTVFESYRLEASDGADLIALWSQMNNRRVKKSSPLDTAIRRFGFAGERTRPEDQIIDLMIAAEALFLPGEDRGESAHKLSLRAGLLLADKDQSARHIATVMKRAYDARSKLAHGTTLKPLRLPDETPATLAEYVAIVSGYMRTAVRTLVEAKAEGRKSPLDNWDDFTFDRLKRKT